MDLHRIQRFEVLAVLGTGGMGTVYRARDPQLERDVAIKVLTESVPTVTMSPDDTIDLRGDSPAAQDDLLREARMMAKLSHPNVLPVYEVGLANGSLFVVMEHIAGQDLESWLATSRSTSEVLAVFAQAGRGLEAAHEHGIVHRDFKPANVLIGDDGRVRVADFGLSRLTARTPAAMVRVDDGRGTPRYMAPELWQGAQATPASDVYAYCSSIDHALGGDGGDGGVDRDRRWRERGLTRAQCEALAAGLSDDSAARPSLAAVLATLRGRASRRRWVIAGGLGLAVAAAGIVVLANRTADPDPACTLDPTLFSGRWDPVRRASLQARLSALDPRPSADRIGRVLATLDAARGAIEDGIGAACDASNGTLTVAQARARASCFERRAYLLGGIVDWSLATRDPVADIEARARVESADCVDQAAPALPANRAAAIALWLQLPSIELAPAKDRIARYAALERAADRVGELELAGRAAAKLGRQQLDLDRIDDADASLLRAYRRMVEAESTVLQAHVVAERSAVANNRHDIAAANQLAQLARDLADKPSTPPRIRAEVDIAVGRAHAVGGDHAAAVRELRRAIDTAHSSHLARLEVTARNLLIYALRASADRAHVLGRREAAAKLGRETLEVAKEAFGTRSVLYATTLDLVAGLAARPGSALAERHQVLDIYRALLPPDHSRVLAARIEVGRDLFVNGRYAEARKEFATVLEYADRNATIRASRSYVRGFLGKTECQLGHVDECLRLIQQAIEESNKNDLTTDDLRRAQIEVELATGKLDAVEEHIAALESRYRSQPEPPLTQIAFLRGAELASVAIQRKQYRRAAKLAREALATLAELRADDNLRYQVWVMLGTALFEQKQYAGARDAYEHAAAAAKSSKLPEPFPAQVEVELARIDVAQGRRAAGLARARKAAAVLEAFPGSVGARAHAAELLKVKSKRRRRRR